jgi:hypothetical protein
MMETPIIMTDVAQVAMKKLVGTAMVVLHLPEITAMKFAEMATTSVALELAVSTKAQSAMMPTFLMVMVVAPHVWLKKDGTANQKEAFMTQALLPIVTKSVVMASTWVSTNAMLEAIVLLPELA